MISSWLSDNRLTVFALPGWGPGCLATWWRQPPASERVSRLLGRLECSTLVISDPLRS